MDFDEVVDTITQDEFVPVVIDAVSSSNVFTARTLNRKKMWSGESIKIPVRHQQGSAGGSFEGLDTFVTTRQNNRILSTFRPKGYYYSTTLSGMDVSVNATKAKVLDLVMTELEDSRISMTDGIGTLFYADGTGNSNKDFTGLAAAVDDGSVAATYGNINRSTYTVWQSDVTTTVGNLTLAQMASSFDAAKVGSDQPTLIVTTEAVWRFYEQLNTPTLSNNFSADGFAQVTKESTVQSRKGLGSDRGFNALFFRGVPVVADEKCTAGYMYFLNENYIYWYSLPGADLENIGGGSVHKGYYSEEPPPVMTFTGWKKPTNAYGKVGQFIMLGELINENPNRSSVMQGITGV